MATVWHLLGNPLGRAKVVRVFFLPRRGSAVVRNDAATALFPALSPVALPAQHLAVLRDRSVYP